MPNYIVQESEKKLICSAMLDAVNLLQDQADADADAEACDIKQIARALDDAFDLLSFGVEEESELPARIILSVRDAFFLRESLREVRAWSEGRRLDPPVGLGHDLDQLDRLINAATSPDGLTPWEKKRADYWKDRRG
jgi:hypothetical protein